MQAARKVTVLLCLIALALALSSQKALAGSGLTYYAYKGDFESVKQLVQSHVDINEQDENGYTALHWAAYNGFAGMARFLLNNGAIPNSKDNDGCTPLIIAASRNKVEVVKALCEKGADPLIMDNSGKNAYQYCLNEHGGSTELSIIIEGYFSDLECGGEPVPTPKPVKRQAPVSARSASVTRASGTLATVTVRVAVTLNNGSIVSLPGADISLINRPAGELAARGKTSLDGLVTLKVPAGKYRLSGFLQHPLYTSFWDKIIVVEGGQEHLFELSNLNSDMR